MVREYYQPGENILLFDKKISFKKKLTRFFFRLFLIFFISTVIQVIYYRFFPPVYTPLMVKRTMEAIFSGKGKKLVKYDWQDYEDVSKHAKLAVVASEDQNFPNHFGLDLKAIKTAMKKNKKGKRAKGASTITQQVAKNLFLLPNRSYFRKALELYYAVLLEIFWPKERILEMYLNVAETGDMIFGIQGASKTYFKKNASALKKNEAALIAAVLPNPIKYSVKKPTAYISRRQTWISRQMTSLGDKYISDL